MVQVNGLEFATSIKVLYTLKEMKGCKTIQETYQLFENADMDTMLEVLVASYNAHNKMSFTTTDIIELFEDRNLGMVVIIDTFTEIIEKLMFSGLSEDEAIKRKNAMTNQHK